MAASSKVSLIGGLAANLGIAVTKLVVGGVTGSTVMLTEAIHSFVDTGNSGLMLLGRRRSAREPDREHPFGYGMELYFWSFVVATIVFGGGGGVSIFQGVYALIDRHPHTPALWPNLLVIAVAAVLESTSFVIAARELAKYRRDLGFEGGYFALIRASKNPAIFLTVLEDGAALAGLALATVGLLVEHVTGDPRYGAVAAILIGLVQIGEALVLGVECRELIIGEAAREPVIEQVEEIIARHDDLRTGHARTLQLGPRSILVVIQLALSEHAPALDALVDDLRREVPAIHDVAFEIVERAES